MKIVLTLAAATGLVILTLLLALRLAGLPIDRSGDDPDAFVLVLIALFFTAAIALFQLAAMALLRLLPWPGPRLKIESPGVAESLKRVFE